MVASWSVESQRWCAEPLKQRGSEVKLQLPGYSTHTAKKRQSGVGSCSRIVW